MAGNANDEVDLYETEEGDHTQQTKYIMWPEEEENDNQRPILQPVSGNGGRKLKGRVETRHGGKERSGNLTALKLFARQGKEKSQLEEWKADLLQNLTSEIAQIHKAHNDSMEAQREEIERQQEQFLFEIEMLKERIRELEREKEGSAHKETRQSTPVQEISEEKTAMSAREEVTTIPSQVHSVKPKEPRSYATVAAAKPAQTPTQPWTKVSYGNRKIKSPAATQVEQRGRRILFPRQDGGEFKSEADLMLALNESLQKAGVDPKVRFSRVRYAPSGSISALLLEKADATMLLPQRSNLLIRAAKTVDDAVVGVEILEQWQRLKVHGMALDRYLGSGKLELLKREVESSTGIQLKTMPRWLISENRLKEEQKKGSKTGSAIVITVSNEIEAKRLLANGLRFGGAVKKVEKYWEAGPGSVCMRCCGIGHERQGSCGDRPEKCVMCAGAHLTSEHQCGVNGCNKGKGKLCIHVVARCANCQGSHPANSGRCTIRQKAQIEARKNKTAKTPELSANITTTPGVDILEKGSPGPSEQEMDEREDWAQSPTPELPLDLSCPESRDHTKDF